MADSLITPAERRRLKVRDSILEAAERVFVSEGEAGLSIRRIADDIDYSPAAIYKYFESKDELINELKEAFFGRILTCVNQLYEEEATFAKRARSCVTGYVRTALEKPHHYIAAFTSEAPQHPTPPDPAEFGTTNRARAFIILAGMVEEGIETGHFVAETDPAETAKYVWAAMHGLAMMIAHFRDFPSMSLMPSAMSQDDFIDLYADRIIRSLEVTPGGSPKNGKG
ncbi:MAG: TetR/AcrR family transcriptional regulator [Henriciella sp.]|uniref:TetR/AcrR family transcriptional regulator n=1 Tax=Henriciella sp. TaxID=1968823 RepID=UPI003C72B17C